MKELKIMLRFLAFMLVLCLGMVWLAGFYFDSYREIHILRGMKAGIIVSILMIGVVYLGVVYLLKEVIIKEYSKRQLSNNG